MSIYVHQKWTLSARKEEVVKFRIRMSAIELKGGGAMMLIMMTPKDLVSMKNEVCKKVKKYERG